MIEKDWTESFWGHVDKKGEDDCWLWTAAVFNSGYGACKPSSGSPLKMTTAHRVAYYIANSALGDSKVFQTCFNNLCCNPKHLRQGKRPPEFRKTIDVQANFWGKVMGRNPEACWIWEGAKCFSYGRRSERITNVVPQEYAYTLKVGPIPSDHLVTSRCGNQKCCNPAHLYTIEDPRKILQTASGYFYNNLSIDGECSIFVGDIARLARLIDPSFRLQVGNIHTTPLFYGYMRAFPDEGLPDAILTSCQKNRCVNPQHLLPVGEVEYERILRERNFWERVQKTDTCWLWTAATDGNGYGSFHMIEFGNRQGKTMSAHKYSYILHYGPIDDGLIVRHYECDNPPCVRPDHLRAGTHKENAQDKIRKGRHRLRSGEDEMILRQYNKKIKELALELNISIDTIKKIANGDGSEK